MGRGLLIFVILMTTIFAGVLTTIQKNVGGVPDTLIKNQLNKELENVSDFVLRKTVREANSQALLDTLFQNNPSGGDMSFVEDYTGVGKTKPKIGNCEIQSLTYSYSLSGHHYKVKSVIKGSMQGIEAVREAEMAFSYPMVTLGKMAPNIVYLEFEQMLLFPWLRKFFGLKNDFPDSSPNHYAGSYYGFSFITPTGFDQTKVDEDVESWTGPYSKRYLKMNGYNSRIVVNRKDQDQATQEGIENFKDLDTNDSFTLVTFAKIDKAGRDAASGLLGFIGGTKDRRGKQGTLIWVPSNPMDANLKNQPSAAIWFETTDQKNYNAKGKLHFAVTQDTIISGKYNTLKVEIEYTRTVPVWKRVGNWLLGYTYGIDTAHFNYPWNSYGLTYEVVGSFAYLKAYVDGNLIGTKTGPPVRAYPNEHGMTLGARDVRKADGSAANDDEETRMHLFGIIDQSGMNDEAFTPQEMFLWHNQVLKSTLVKYIKD